MELVVVGLTGLRPRRGEVKYHGYNTSFSDQVEREHREKSNVHEDEAGNGDEHCRRDHSREVSGRVAHVTSYKTDLESRSVNTIHVTGKSGALTELVLTVSHPP